MASKVPYWWGWELEFSPHLLRRMRDRRFTEVDLRAMLESPTTIRPDTVPGRWLIAADHDDLRWEVVVEPDEHERLIVVVTAYRVGE